MEKENIKSPELYTELAVSNVSHIEPSKDVTDSSDPFVDIAEMYMRDMRKYSLLSASDEAKYLELAKNGDIEARDYVLQCNLRLVVCCARCYRNRGVDFIDLISEGNLGLVTAIKKFKPELGYRFSTYAMWWIRHYIGVAVMNQSRSIRLPCNVIKKLQLYLRKAWELSGTLLRMVTSTDISKTVNSTSLKVDEILGLNAPMLSLEESCKSEFGDINKLYLFNVLQDNTNKTPYEIAEEDSIVKLVQSCKDKLTMQQQHVIARRFGLWGCEIESLKKIGKELGISNERVRQIQLESFRVLRAALEKQNVTPETSIYD